MNRRSLKTIASEIAIALKCEVENVVEVGRLLTEAKEQLGAHGQWLPWLNDNFSLSIRTAQKYMAAAALAGEYELDSHLRISVGALYALVDADRDGNVQAVKAALGEAKVKWVDDDRVREIIAALQQPDEASDEDSSKDDKPDSAAPPPDDDRPPPAPPPSLSPRQAAQLSKFEAAAKELLGLMAKPAREFLATAISDFDLETAAGFLQQVAKEKLKAAGGSQGGGDVAQAMKTG
jgi:hypothetical protein